jgi:3-oxoadipate enol-lactonase
MLEPRKIPLRCPFHDPCLELNYFDEGLGEAIILVHGLGEEGLSWRLQIEEFSQHYRVIAPDLRGHGASGHRDDEIITLKRFADDIIALVRHLGVGQAHFCGMSLGGLVVLEIFCRYPNLVKSITLADTAVFFPPPDPLQERLELLDRLGLVEWAKLVPYIYLRPGASSAQKAEVAAMVSNNRLAPYRQSVVATFTADYRWLLPLVDVPTLILVGEEDQIVSPGIARYTHRSIPGSTLRVIPRAGHLSNLDNPQAFAAEVLAHLARLQTTADTDRN